MNTNNEHGTSLIEVLISMLMLTLLITGLNAGVLTMMQNNAASKQLVVATAEGNALLENLRQMNYDSVAAGSDVVRNRFARSWSVEEDSAQKKVDLVVSWPASFPSHTISLSTIIARR